MYKFNKKFLIIFLLLFALFISPSCKKNNQKTYSITYLVDGGILTNQPLSYDGSVDVMLTAPIKEGYEFKGWYDNELFIGTPISIINKGEKGDKTFYAKWIEIPKQELYFITFVTNGGILLEQPINYDQTQEVILPIPIKEGYTFEGWYQVSDFTGENVSKIEKGSTGNKVFYANWSIDLHVHEFINGICECGEKDPNYVPPHVHNFVEGICECGETDPNYIPPHVHDFVEGKCECGETDPTYVPPHVHNFIDGICECGEIDSVEIEYSILIKDIAGKPLSNFHIYFCKDNDVVIEDYTNQNGTINVNLPRYNYQVIVEERAGYYLDEKTFETDLIGTQIVIEAGISSLKGIEGDIFTRYELGDVMYDFTLTNTEGESLNLYDLLAEKKLVILNFWYTTCSACQYEFPYMVEAYESTYVDAFGNTKYYKDDIVIIAVNPTIAGSGDNLEAIKSFKQSMNLSFDVALDVDDDELNLTFDPLLTTQFGVYAYPTTIAIDSYGLIAGIGVGAITSTENWTKTFDKYISDDYFPVYTGKTIEEDLKEKPDFDQEDSSVLETALNGTNYDGTKFNGTYAPEDNEDAEYSWPWVVETFKGKNCIKPSNYCINSSYSIVYVTTYLKVGEVLTFDYFSSTEDYDYLYIVIDDVIVTSIAGISSNWETSYAFLALEEKEYEIGFCYLKDYSYSAGEDSVFISNMRILTEEDIDKETYVLRECATGLINEFTMTYQNYVNVVYNEEDGYYHVGTATGPYLLADMLSGTKWNDLNLYEISLEGMCIGADGVDYNKVIEEYAIYASNSTVGYTPVTKELADALKEVTKALGDPIAAMNPNQWLEVCVYYSAYGTGGKEFGLPTIGVCPFEPIMFEGSGIEKPATASGMIDRKINPRGLIFGFVPEVSGVYKFYGVEEIETLGWACDKDGVEIQEADKGLREFAKILTNGGVLDDNFIIYIYLEAGELYLFRACFYDIYEYSEINVEISFVGEQEELLTIASPGFFTSSDDEMKDIISGNYVDVELNNEGYYVVKDGLASDNYLYCDITYINNITGTTLLQVLSDKYCAFDFSKDEYGFPIVDEEGYYRATDFDENYNIICYYVCYDANGEYYQVTKIGEDGKTIENGYTYVKFTEDDLKELGYLDYTKYVTKYIEDNMVTDENSELYGCVKVDAEFVKVLGFFMNKYTFEGIEYSWLKLCYYYKYLGPEKEN